MPTSMGWGNRSHKRIPLDRDESVALCLACKNIRERMLIWTLLDTGLRINEYCKLEPKAINWQAHYITVLGKNTSRKRLGEDGIPNPKKKRIVPMTRRVQTILQDYFTHTSSIDMSERNANYIIKKIQKGTMITKAVSPHVLRHTFAVDCLQNGVSLPALQQLLGHEDLQTTAIYLNLSNDGAVREYLDKLGGHSSPDYVKEFENRMMRERG